MFVEEPVKLGHPRQPKIDASMRNFAPRSRIQSAAGRFVLCLPNRRRNGSPRCVRDSWVRSSKSATSRWQGNLPAELV
jgi:hypothetical protein